ncbi:MFS transporter [Kribbella albertanoniae]|uniref:MFS transporter n=1 Tax=Kribbella albertanoniae TaxID=1266829 RepID=UPI001EDDC202|nr:MFS transporter [Kribbella albertanoniae]
MSARTVRGRPGIVAALAVTQTVGYGVLYYVFGVFLGPMSDDLRISPVTAAGAMTVSVLISGALSVPIGRWLDVRGGHGLMTAGSLLGSCSVIAWSQVQSAVQLYVAFAGIGVASSMVLYAAASAVLVNVLEPARRSRALLAVTLVAGLGSTIFIPLAGQLVDRVGWRDALLVLALLHNVVTVPLHLIALRGTARASRSTATGNAHDQAVVARALRDAGFWLLTIGFVLHNAAIAVVTVHLVFYLVASGHSPTVAAGLAGLLGIFSVAGRIVIAVLQRWLPLTSVAPGIFLLQGAAIAVLPAVDRFPIGALACVTVFGFGFGFAALATPVILLDRYGVSGFATISGYLATPVFVARALAPLGAAVIAAGSGYRLLMLPVVVACFLASLCLSLTWYLPASKAMKAH